MEPMSLIMLGLIGLLIIMMVRNGRKRREQINQMQQGLVPGAEVMLQTGIYATFLKFDDEDENRAVLQSGETTLIVHRQAIGQIVTQAETVTDAEESNSLAPDDDPAFGESLNQDTESSEQGTDPETPDAPATDDK